MNVHSTDESIDGSHVSPTVTHCGFNFIVKYRLWDKKENISVCDVSKISQCEFSIRK